MSKRAAVIATYLALLVLQPVWHGLLPSPLGAGNWILAVVATLPLLLPLKGILQGSIRSMTLAAYLVVLYFIIGVTEAWSNDLQRYAAIVQIVLSVLYMGSVVAFTRPPRQA